MSNDLRRMVHCHHDKNSLLPSINFKHVISSLVILLLVTATSSQQQSPAVYECPNSCVCNEIDLSARCENLDSLIKSYSTKHHRNRFSNLMPIKSLDLSNNQLTKISTHLELLVNLTTLNLSHNQLTHVQKLHFEHLEKLDLSYNRITSGKLSKLPRNVVHLNLTHNDITYLPVDFMKLKKLRTLELNENPLNCTCDTLMVRNWIGLQSVWSSKAIVCHAPQMFKGQPWLQARQNDICIEQPSTTTSSSNDKWENFDVNDVMMGDQPMDDEQLEKDEDYANDADGKTEDEDIEYDNDDSINVFDDEAKQTTADDNTDANDVTDDNDRHNENELKEEFIPVGENHNHDHHHEVSTSEPATSVEKVVEEDVEGSGQPIAPANVEEEEDGSGSGGGFLPIIHHEPSPPTEEDHSEEPEVTDAPTAQRVNVGNNNDVEAVPNVDAKTDESGKVQSATTEDNSGTYVLLAIIGILLVSLIIFVAMKNRKEKQQNRRRYDVEKNNATELQDMDKSLLGKPLEKNGNGKHAEHSPLINEFAEPKEYKPYNAPAITVDEPVQELPQKSQQSLYDNNLPNGNGHAAVEPIHGNGSLPKSPDSDDEIFHPAVESPEALNVAQETPKRYSPIYSSPTSPKSARYSPVYDEQGRVKIKLTETPKPKTPVIVNRTRSRAGDYINTPN